METDEWRRKVLRVQQEMAQVKVQLQKARKAMKRKPTEDMEKEIQQLEETYAILEGSLTLGSEKVSMRRYGQGDPKYRKHIIETVVLTKYSQYDENHPFVRALQRGIGVHYAGLSKAYRSAVEILFRTTVCFAMALLLKE